MHGGCASSSPWAPLGAALAAYHSGRHDAAVHVESDAFAPEVIPASAFYRPRSTVLPPLEVKALSLCRGRVLDFGAGAGRHALELQDLGLKVTALDVDPEAVRVMRERGVRDARRAEAPQVGDEIFDTILLLMNGIGVAGELRGLEPLLCMLSAVLAPRGQIICDSADLLAEFSHEDLEALRPRAFGNLLLGEVSFRLRFADLEGGWYPWLFASEGLLAERAALAALDLEVVSRGPRGSFLTRLTRRPG